MATSAIAAVQTINHGPELHVGQNVIVDGSASVAGRLHVVGDARLTRVLSNEGAETFDNTAGPLTITAAMVIGGSLLRDPNGAGRTDVLPTAALLVAAFTTPQVGDIVKLYVVNCADAAETITMSAGTGGTWNVNQPAAARVITQNNSRWVFIRLTNVTSGAEAYSCWM